MKKKFLFLVVIVFVSFHGIAQYNWQTLTNAPVAWRLDDCYFLTPQMGWAVSPDYERTTSTKLGQIYRTLDGGNTWQLQRDTAHIFFRSIGFCDANTGWVGSLCDTSATVPGDTIPFFHTTDGGATWAPVTNIPNPKPKGICGISTVTDSVTYAYGRYFGPAVLIKTTDKGATWSSQDLSVYASGLIDAHFVNKDTGFVTGSSPNHQGTILSTFDGGLTWQVRYLSTRTNQEGVWKIVFPTRNVAYASIEHWGCCIPYPTFYLKSTDGGMTWTEHSFLENYDLQGIGFINDSVGWIGGDEFAMTYKTTDGGNTWNQDSGFGTITPPYYTPGGYWYVINRFRRFGDTLMYASGNTVYKMQKGLNTGISELSGKSSAISCYPNPFRNQTRLTYTLKMPARTLTLHVVNLMGEELYTQALGEKSAGLYSQELNLDLPAGIYFCSLKSENQVLITKILVER